MRASTNNQNLHWQTKSKYPTQTSEGEAISLRAPAMSKGVAMATTTVSATATTMVSTKKKGEVFSDWPLWICLAAAGMEKTKRYGDSRGSRWGAGGHSEVAASTERWFSPSILNHILYI